MEVQTLLIDHVASEKQMGFHPGVQENCITCLVFADDVLVFSDGKPTSIGALCSTLEKYYRLSGLCLNAEKSEIFCSGLADRQIDELVAASERHPPNKIPWCSLDLLKT